MQPLLSLDQTRRLVELSFPKYAPIRSEYWRKINQNVTEYLQEPTKDDNWFTNAMRLAVDIAFVNAALVAWQDGLGGETELSVDAAAWVVAYKLAHYNYIESLLLSLRVKKYPGSGGGLPSSPTEPLDEIEVMSIAQQRAEGYAKGLDILYNNTKVRGAGDRILLFTGDDGMESCFDCQKYKGKRHTATWWILNNAVPPNRDFECKGYNCLHILIDVLTNKVFTI